MYLRPDYDQKLAEQCNHNNDRNSSAMGHSPEHSYNAAQTMSVSHLELPHHSPAKGKPASPGKARGLAGESHKMTLEEMKERYLQLECGASLSNL
jgi:hypothetical protein